MRWPVARKRFAKTALLTDCMLVSVARNRAYMTVLQVWPTLPRCKYGMTTESRHAHIALSPH